MGRQHSRATKRAAGVPVPNYNSKTSPSHIKYQAHRKKPSGIGRPLYRYHKKRNDLRHELAKELGLPPDTKFVFRRGADAAGDIDAPDVIEISHGTVVVIDKEDMSLVLAVRCTLFSCMDSNLRNNFSEAISTTYIHAHARNKCKTNSAHKKDDEEGHLVAGWMGHCGWRAGWDHNRSAGAYAMSAFTSANIERILADEARMRRFPWIRDFLAGRFAILSLSVFKTNLALAFVAAVPGFEQRVLEDTPNGRVFASNIMVSCFGFANVPHVDKDHTRYAFGLWSLIDRVTGRPIDRKTAEGLGSVEGACFIVKKFGLKVILGRCDGTYEMLWDTQIPHYTSTSIARDAHGNVIDHLDCKVTMYGSSCQIAQSLVNQIKILQKDRETMTDAQWKVFKEKKIKSYNCESLFKRQRLQKPVA